MIIKLFFNLFLLLGYDDFNANRLTNVIFDHEFFFSEKIQNNYFFSSTSISNFNYSGQIYIPSDLNEFRIMQLNGLKYQEVDIENMICQNDECKIYFTNAYKNKNIIIDIISEKKIELKSISIKPSSKENDFPRKDRKFIIKSNIKTYSVENFIGELKNKNIEYKKIYEIESFLKSKNPSNYIPFDDYYEFISSLNFKTVNINQIQGDYFLSFNDYLSEELTQINFDYLQNDIVKKTNSLNNSLNDQNAMIIEYYSNQDLGSYKDLIFKDYVFTFKNNIDEFSFLSTNNKLKNLIYTIFKILFFVLMFKLFNNLNIHLNKKMYFFYGFIILFLIFDSLLMNSFAFLFIIYFYFNQRKLFVNIHA